MSYPNASDWTSNAPFSAWYVEARSGQPSKVCQTDGWNFLRDLQDQLRTRLSDTGPLPGPDGSAFSANSVVVNDVNGPRDGWTPKLLSALWAVAAHDRAPSAYLTSVAADAVQGTVGTATLSTAIWEAYLNASQTGSGDFIYGAGSPDEARIPSGSILPVWGVSLPVPVSHVVTSGLTCRAVPSVPALQPLPGIAGWLYNPWVIAGAMVVVTGGMLLVARNVPAVRRKNPSRRRRTR